MKSFDQIFDETMKCDKGTLGGHGHGYGPIYEKYLGHLRDEPINIAECGIQFGASARSWLEIFPKATVYGIDVWGGHGITDPRFKFYTGDQNDIGFWERFKSEVPKLHFFCDDASHYPLSCIATFQAMWPYILPSGLFACEDTHSFWHPQWSQGGAGQKWISDLFGDVNWNGKKFHGNPTPAPYTLDYFERTIERIELTKGLMLIWKREVEAT